MSSLVSVIVPVYKVEPYLDQCIRSLANQSHHDIEIILIDDGSPDLSGAICDHWSEKDSRIKVIHKPNGGVSDARNVGVGAATGHYLTFVDSDDWVHPLYIERLLDLLLRADAHLSLCNYSRTTPSGVLIEPEPSEEAQHPTQLTGTTALGEYLEYRISNTLWAKLYRRELFEGITFPVGHVHEDMYTTYKLLHRAPLVTRTGDRLYYYRSRPDSIIGAGFTPDHARDYIAAREAEAEYYDSHGLLEYRDIANERLYGKYERLIDALDAERPDDWADIMAGFGKLRTDLRKGSHSLRFRMRTEAYFTSPRLFRFLRRTISRPSAAVVPAARRTASTAGSLGERSEGPRDVNRW